MSRRSSDWPGYIGFLAASALVFVLPRRAVLSLGRGLGRLAFRLDRRHRRIALENLDQAFGREKSPAERLAIARASFAHFGRVTLEVIKLTHLSKRRVLKLIDVEGREHLEKARAAGRGVLIFTAHYGNWETIVPPVSEIGPFHVVARILDNRLVDGRLNGLRMRMGAVVIDKMGAARSILGALGRGAIVAILIDQNVLRSQAVFVDFFGRPAATTPGLAQFHIRTGASLVPVFCVPRGRRLTLEIRPALDVPLGGRKADDVLNITQICTKMIEEEIRRAPQWWLWFHRRWNTRPAGEAGPT